MRALDLQAVDGEAGLGRGSQAQLRLGGRSI